MSTENIEGLEELEELIGKVGPQVKQRRQRIRKESEGRQRHEQHIATGAAVLIKRSKDLREELAHEDEQLADVERMAQAFVEAIDEPESDDEDDQPVASPSPAPPEPPEVIATPDEPVVSTPEPEPEPPEVIATPDEPVVSTPGPITEPPPIYTPAELEEMPLDQLQRLADYYVNMWGRANLPPYDVEMSERQRLMRIVLIYQEFILPGEEEPEQPASVPPANPPTVVQNTVVVPERPRSPYHPRNWRPSCWIWAAVGLVIGLLVGLKTHEFVTDEVSAWKWVPGTIWVLAIGAAGLFAGALLCTFVCEYRDRQQAANQPQPAAG